MTMLGALIFRGVAFEFRFKATRSRLLWDTAFALGSITAAFCQGLILGTFVHGYTGNHLGTPDPTGKYFVWFSPFSITTGIAVVCGYALLGATWLVMKTEDGLQDYMFHIAKIFLIAVGIFAAIVSLWTPFIDSEIMHRWFSLPNFFFFLPLPLITAGIWIYCLYALYQRYEKYPFVMSVLLFICCYIGLAISVWPYLVPRSITIWEAASNPKSLIFLLVGTLILLPLLIGYTLYAYYVFKGKVKTAEGYE
jgi:cytochrome d ubiquinol oxidase subunit II